jgi:hypothetical protein
MARRVHDRPAGHLNGGASTGRIWFGSILVGLGCAVAIAGVIMGSYALSPDPDTARSTLVSSAVPLILGASALLSLASVLLQRTATFRWLTEHRTETWAITASSLAVSVLMVWVAASTWPGDGGWVFPAGFALSALLVVAGVRHALLPIAAALVLCGVLAEVASTLPQ